MVVKSNSSRRMPGSHPSSAAAPAPSPSAPGWRNGDSSITPAPAARPQAPLSGQPSYETPASAYGKPLDTGFNNGNAIVRAAMSMLPVDNMPAQGANQRAPVGLPQGPDAGNATPAPFHDQLSAAAPEILTQMGYRRAPAYGPEGAWGNGSAVRGQDPAARVESPPVLVLQPGWGVTLPPYFLGMTDAKRPRNVPVKVRCGALSLLPKGRRGYEELSNQGHLRLTVCVRRLAVGVPASRAHWRRKNAVYFSKCILEYFFVVRRMRDYLVILSHRTKRACRRAVIMRPLVAGFLSPSFALSAS